MNKGMTSVNKPQEATGNGRIGTGNTGSTATKWLGSAAAPMLGNYADPPVLGDGPGGGDGEQGDGGTLGSTAMEDLRKAGNKALLAAGMLVRTVESPWDWKDRRPINKYKKKWEKKKEHIPHVYI